MNDSILKTDFQRNKIKPIHFHRLYNDSPVGETVVTNDRWGIGTLCKHGDFLTCSDRFNPGVLQKKKWENAMTIDKRSWGYRADARLDDFLTSHDLIKGKIEKKKKTNLLHMLIVFILEQKSL